ncbi:MAG: hypothetical protein ACE1ZA_20285, partial [Pseudomonadales bacterium]
MRHLSMPAFVVSAALIASACTPDTPETDARSTDYDWPHYANDQGSSKYARIDQINAKTVRDLQVAWVWESVDNAMVEA